WRRRPATWLRVAGLKQLNWASEGVGSKAAALVDLSTVAGNKISNPPWVKFQSAGWVNFPSAPTENLHLGIRAQLKLPDEQGQNLHSGSALRYLMLMASIDWHFRG
ncbi:hypothetical protein, partial [Pseudomonas aeruginosa]